MSMPTKWHLAWPCFPVFEVDTSATCVPRHRVALGHSRRARAEQLWCGARVAATGLEAGLPDLAGSVVDDDVGVLTNSAGLLGVGQRSSSIRGLKGLCMVGVTPALVGGGPTFYIARRSPQATHRPRGPTCFRQGAGKTPTAGAFHNAACGKGYYRVSWAMNREFSVMITHELRIGRTRVLFGFGCPAFSTSQAVTGCPPPCDTTSFSRSQSWVQAHAQVEAIRPGVLACAARRALWHMSYEQANHGRMTR
ncbi:hypothetical protein HaLaN_31937 [Haematococcus lacustris]|uniref:Uncharacterized protein n=1 Tax=Haematococcus lacustris TaxID=44745 RepID=A0A6A0AIF5_HAELA|nr:hypothetical protein HaLaN_31937 [Haematococcus lacustris]